MGQQIATLALLLLSTTAMAQQDGLPFYKHLVEIDDGRHLNLVCMGQGSPTVVFMQGLGSNFADWRRIREPVAAFTRTCFYDRAGYGYSDPTKTPPTVENVISDFHTLLHAAGIKERVVLVGASLGGLFATYYTDKFGSEVAGLVLDDPSFSGQFNYAVSAQDAKIIEDDGNSFNTLMQTCEKFAEAGELSKGDSHGCFFLPRDITPGDAEYLAHQYNLPNYYAIVRSEFEDLRQRREGDGFVDGVYGEEERLVARTFGDLPMIVLTGGLMARAMNS